MSKLPLSVVIATHNRREELRTTLAVLRVREPVAEIIVIDNGSSDDTASVVQQEFPEVRLIERPCNEGVPAFGIGMQAASQPYVFLLDDDAVPELGALSNVVDLFSQYPQIAVVACHIVDRLGTPITSNWPTYPICFWGCGAGVRRKALTNQPYLFDPRLLLHGTEMDLAVRLYAEGYVVRYTAGAVVHHRFSSQNRSSSRRIYFLVQNALWFGLKHLPLRFALPAIGRHLAWLFHRALRAKCLSAYVLGLLDACGQVPSVLKERRPVPPSVARHYYEQVWEYEPLIFRVMRALVGKPPSRRDTQRGFPVPQ